jgi:hypothetical protein
MAGAKRGFTSSENFDKPKNMRTTAKQDGNKRDKKSFNKKGGDKKRF